MTAKAAPKPIYTHLYVQVLIGITIGVALGYFWPGAGAAMKPLGDGFIRLIRMIIAPIIFGTVVVGIAKMGDMKNVGRIGLTALIYFEIVSTLALIIGLIVINLVQPGAGINADPATLDASSVKAYASSAAGSDCDRVPDEHHSGNGRGRVRERGDPAGAVLLGPVWPRASPLRREGPRPGRHHRRSHARALRRCRPHHAGRARSAPSAQWRSPSASTASARCSRSAS